MASRAFNITLLVAVSFNEFLAAVVVLKYPTGPHRDFIF